MPEQRTFVLQDAAQRAGEIGLQEAQAVAFGQPDVEGGKVQRRQILVAPTAGRRIAHLGTMQVDQRQTGRSRIDRQMQQEVADVEIAMIDAAAMHAPRHLGHAPDQRALESRRRRYGAPVATEILEADGGREFLGNDEGMPPCRVAAALGEGHGAHRVDAEGRESLQRTPFIAGAKHRQAAGQQVLENLKPADAAMDLDVVAATGDLGAQGTAPFERAQHLALQVFDGGEGILSGPVRTEWLLKTSDVLLTHNEIVS
jgi:hypothetical protein